MDKQQPQSDTFALFVKAVEGAMVRRYGTNMDIGVVADGKGSVAWDIDTIHVLTHDEVAKYGVLYQREIDGKRLVKASREDWDNQRKERKAKAKEAAAEVADKAVKEANEAARVDAQVPTELAKKGSG